MTFICPVCEYDALGKPPQDYSICPSCGTEFDADDVDKSIDELRREWIHAGAPWFSARVRPPRGWEEHRQRVLIQLLESDGTTAESVVLNEPLEASDVQRFSFA